MPLSLEAILSNSDLRHGEFPITAEMIFLAHSSTSPFPRRVWEAARTYGERHLTSRQGEYYREMEGVRGQAARFLGVSPEEVGFCGSTAYGLGVIAESFPWGRGDRVLCQQYDFPANLAPWVGLEQRGVVTLDWVEFPKDGRLTWEHLQRFLNPGTRMVTLSAVHYLTGHRPNLEEIGIRLRELGSTFHPKGTLLCVDAIQSLGAVPCPIGEHVDFLAAGGQKWLLSPKGTGLFYIRKRHLETMRPMPLGWLSPRKVSDYVHPDFRPEALKPSAARFELGTANVPGILALGEALALFAEIGPEAIAGHILALHDRVVALAVRHGLPLAIPYHEKEECSGITSLCIEGEGVAQRALKHLESRKIEVSVRPGWEGTPLLRFAPHFYNTFSDIETAFEVLLESLRS